MASKQTYEEYKKEMDDKFKKISPAPLDRLSRGLKTVNSKTKNTIDKTFKGLKLDKNARKINPRYIQSNINIPTQRVLSRSQLMLTEVLGGSGEQLWGTGNNIPKINEGSGIDRNDNGQTGSLFGIKRRRGFI